MPIEAVTPAAGGTGTAAPAPAPKQAMDGEVFMNLLVTQLRNQDPSTPMDTNQMITQTTQLAMMEKFTELVDTGKEDFSLQMRTAAAALLGQEVTYTGDDGADATGVATAVSYRGPVPHVTIEGRDVPLDSVSGVVSGPAALPSS